MNHFTPRPELFAPGREAELESALLTVHAATETAALAAGMPPTLWSQANHSVAHRSYLRSGLLPDMLPIPSLFLDTTPLTPQQKRMLPERAIRDAYHLLQFSKIQFYCFTQNEDWWAGAPAFIAEDIDSYVRMRWYCLARKDATDLRSFVSVSGPGRPKKDATQKSPPKFQSTNGLWAAWKAQILAEKAALIVLRDRWKELEMEADAARLAFREAEKNDVTSWEQYKAKHTT